MIERIIKNFDIYGSPFSLKINGQNKFKSTTGGFFSILTMGILLMTIIYFGKNFYRRQNPKLTVEEGLYQNSDIPILQGSQYEEREFVLTYEKRYDSLIKPFVTQQIMNSFNNESIYQQIYLQDCSIEYLLNKSMIKSKEDLYYTFYSFKCLRLNDFKIGSLYNQDQTGPLIINLQKCSDIDKYSISRFNLTNCDSSSDEVIDYLPLNIWYDKIGFSPNSKYPFTKKTIPSPHILSKDKINFIYFPLSLYYLNDDIGWIFNSTEISFTFNFNGYNFAQYPNSDKVSYPLLSIVIYVSDDFKVFTRTYEKIQDLLAIIGGFMKIVFAMLNLLNIIIRAYLMDNYLVGRIFDNGEAVNSSHYKVNKNNFQSIKSVQGNKINSFFLPSRNERSNNSKLCLNPSIKSI